MTTKTIPLISSGISGPLGVLHLPRLWQKVSLERVGRLNGEYPAVGGGFDQMVLDALAVGNDAFNVFMQSKPSYPQLESWILEQQGGALDQVSVATLNASIVGYQHSEETRKEILAASGIDDEGSILDAVNLNNLDDWQSFHAQEIV
jgi:hypothetical protein